VECAPYEAEPKFCKTCGAKINAPLTHCQRCGNKLFYEGGEEDEPKTAVSEFGEVWLRSQCDEEKQGLSPMRQTGGRKADGLP
jgi:hypothetical protein